MIMGENYCQNGKQREGEEKRARFRNVSIFKMKLVIIACLKIQDLKIELQTLSIIPRTPFFNNCSENKHG